MSDIGGIPSERLRSFIERLENIEAEIKSMNADKSDIYAEAKGTGFDVKIMKEVIKLRKLESNDRQERDTLLDLYMAALGMIPSFEADDPAPRVHVQVHVREEAAPKEATKNDLPAAAEAAGTESREGATAPEPGSQPEATADGLALRPAETAANNVTAPLHAGAGGRRDSQSQPARSDARQTPGADAPGDEKHRSADTEAQGSPPQPSEDPHEMGAAAFRRGEVANRNPFEAGDPRRKQWVAGWMVAQKQLGDELAAKDEGDPRPAFLREKGRPVEAADELGFLAAS